MTRPGATLHRRTQIVDKVRLALTPWLNHGWHMPLYVGARGLGTSAIHVGKGVCEIELDLVDHRFVLRSSFAPAGPGPSARASDARTAWPSLPARAPCGIASLRAAAAP